MSHVVRENATQKETSDGKTVFAGQERGINDHYGFWRSSSMMFLLNFEPEQ